MDEAHSCLESEWGNDKMRQDMRRAPAFLKAQFQSTTKPPVLAMTASAQISKSLDHSNREIEQIAALCSIHHSPYITVMKTPILSNQIFVRLLKPPATYNFRGQFNNTNSDKVKSGASELLWNIYLKHFVKCIEDGTQPKKAIIYVTNLIHLMDINEFFREKLIHLDVVKNPQTCPWILNNSNAGKNTIEKIRQRSKDPNGGIYLYVTTSVMLMGLDIKDISLVILFSPFSTLNAFLQAGGRAGRRMADGHRKKSVIYALYNNSEIKSSIPHMDKNVRDMYKTVNCLKRFTNQFFCESSLSVQNEDWCCSNCSLSVLMNKNK